MESFTKMLNAQLILLVYMAVGMYCMKIHLIDQETKKKLVDLILKITLPCRKPLPVSWRSESGSAGSGAC